MLMSGLRVVCWWCVWIVGVLIFICCCWIRGVLLVICLFCVRVSYVLWLFVVCGWLRVLLYRMVGWCMRNVFVFVIGWYCGYLVMVIRLVVDVIVLVFELGGFCCFFYFNWLEDLLSRWWVMMSSWICWVFLKMLRIFEFCVYFFNSLFLVQLRVLVSFMYFRVILLVICLVLVLVMDVFFELGSLLLVIYVVFRVNRCVVFYFVFR